MTWLSSLDSVSPEKGSFMGLTPMISLCSYASTVVLAGHVFACHMVELNGSKQLALGRVVLDYEMGESITEPVLGDVFTYDGSLTVTIDSQMQLNDQVCKSQFFVDAYLIEVKHKEAIISGSRWDPRIWSYLFMGLTLRLECMDFCDLSNFANQVMVQAGISPSLSEKRLVIHINLLEKSIWEFNIEQGQKRHPFF